MTVFDLFGLAAACVAIFAAWYAYRSFKRVLEIEDAIYKRLDEEYPEFPHTKDCPVYAEPGADCTCGAEAKPTDAKGE